MKNYKKYIVWVLLLFFSGLIILSSQGCNLFKKKYEKTENKEYNISAKDKKKLFIENPNGDVIINKNSTDSLVHIKAQITKYVSKKDLDKPLEGIDIEIDSTGDAITISDQIFKEKHIIRFEIGKSSKINYVISVPEYLEINVEGTNGDLELQNLNNNVKADFTNGDVKLNQVYGEIRLELTNGSINAKLDSAKKLDFETTNGNIKLELAQNFEGRFTAETTNGKIIRKNLDFNVSDSAKKVFKGRLGSKDVDVKLTTTNGRITIEGK